MLTMYTLNSPKCRRDGTQSWIIQWRPGSCELLFSDSTVNDSAVGNISLGIMVWLWYELKHLFITLSVGRLHLSHNWVRGRGVQVTLLAIRSNLCIVFHLQELSIIGFIGGQIHTTFDSSAMLTSKSPWLRTVIPVLSRLSTLINHQYTGLV